VANASLWLGRHVAGMDDVPDAIAAEEGGTWTPQHAGLTQDLLHRAHGVNLLVIPWTVNAPGDMRRLIGWGVDGLITDWPDRGLRALANRPAEAKRS
jgi:glycerophosphoryl diester phosphodiesterase